MQKIDWKSLGFAFIDTRCHVHYKWRNGAWDKGALVTEPYIKMHIAASCLHYGQEAFEGLKAFGCRDGKVRIFRPQANGERLISSARRTCMAAVPVEIFVEAVKRAVKANEDFVPPYGTGGSMYIRPLLLGTSPQIGVAPATEYDFLVMVMPVGPYYKGGLKPVRALILDEYDRAAPLGTGAIKVGGNYAASLYAHEAAKRAGYPVELYLDAKTHTMVEEFATSNFIGIKPDGTYVTPVSPSILPSVTNDTLKRIAADLGIKVEERPVPFEEIESFAEVAACGTAVVVTPICEITRGSKVIKIGDPERCGPVLQKLYDTVQGIQYGELQDSHGWCIAL